MLACLEAIVYDGWCPSFLRCIVAAQNERSLVHVTLFEIDTPCVVYDLLNKCIFFNVAECLVFLLVLRVGVLLSAISLHDIYILPFPPLGT